MNFERLLYSSDSIYHYTKLATALEKILTTGKLKITRCQLTNDPREYQAWNPLTSVPKNQTNFNPQVFNELKIESFRKFKILKNNSKLVCLSQNLNNRKAPVPAFIKYRMWSQYADDHKGIAIIFSKKALCSAIKLKFGKFVFSGNVIYKNNHFFDIEFNGDRLNEEGYIKEFFVKQRQEIFFKKHVDYRDESEYRIIVIDEKSEDFFIDIKKCIIGIILGDRFPKIYFPIISSFCEKYKIRAWKLTFWNCRYNLKEFGSDI